MSQNLQSQVISGKDIVRVIDLIQPAVIGQVKSHVMLACLAMVISLHQPDLEPQPLNQAIEDIAEYISIYLAPPEEGKAN